MFREIIFRVGLCIALLGIVSCSAPESTPPKKVAEANKVETAKADSEEPAAETSEVIVALGDKKLTMQHIEWMRPNPDDKVILQIANWWIENELMYAEAVKQGVTNEPKSQFLAELTKRRALSQQLRARVQEAVEISDEKMLAFYEENKQTNAWLKQPGHLSFSHITTKTPEEAQAALERIKAGEDINALAKELSVHRDAKKGGAAKEYAYTRVRRQFGDEFFSSLMAAEKDDLIEPVKTARGLYEIARLENKTESKPLPFEKAKEKIKSRLMRTEQQKAFESLLNSLKEQAAEKIVKSPRLIQAEKADSKKPARNKVIHRPRK